MAKRADFEAMLPDLVALRRDLHAHPEIGFKVERTAGLSHLGFAELGEEACQEGVA